jgi:transcriptional repressor NrdR
MNCPYCGADDSKVISTSRAVSDGVRRRRECKACSARYTTFEHTALAMPFLVKQNGDREAFDRDKLIRGIRMACAKRPVPAAAIQRLATDVEHELRYMGCEEVSSRAIGDLVVRGLREIDQVAYIRYALIHLQLHNLEGVLTEIDRLMTVKAR